MGASTKRHYVEQALHCPSLHGYFPGHLIFDFLLAMTPLVTASCSCKRKGRTQTSLEFSFPSDCIFFFFLSPKAKIITKTVLLSLVSPDIKIKNWKHRSIFRFNFIFIFNYNNYNVINNNLYIVA